MDGKVELGDRRYLLSPQDLAGIDVLADLVRSGVASLKIEGRLKSPEYVASITRVYRQALDRVMATLVGSSAAGAGRQSLPGVSKSSDAPSPGRHAQPATLRSSDPRYELQMAFSRGLYPGWFRGNNNQELAHARFGTKRGVFLGEVAHVGEESISLRLVAPAKPGDGIVFDAGKPDEREEGGRIYQIEPGTNAGESRLRFGHGDIDWPRVRPGQLVWKTNDPALDRELRATFEGGADSFPAFDHPRSPRARRRCPDPHRERRQWPCGQDRIVPSARRRDESTPHAGTPPRATRPARRHAVQTGRIEILPRGRRHGAGQRAQPASARNRHRTRGPAGPTQTVDAVRADERARPPAGPP